MLLTDRVAIVTGGGGGMGRAIALGWSEEQLSCGGAFYKTANATIHDRPAAPSIDRMIETSCPSTPTAGSSATTRKKPCDL